MLPSVTVLLNWGAAVRNALNWSKQINVALYKFGQEAEVMFASHSWPRWGNGRIQEVLRAQRDAYANLNNQSLHYANRGVTINEIHNVYEVPQNVDARRLLADAFEQLGYQAENTVDLSVRVLQQELSASRDADWVDPAAAPTSNTTISGSTGPESVSPGHSDFGTPADLNRSPWVMSVSDRPGKHRFRRSTLQSE